MCMSCACGMCMWHVLVMFMFMCMCMCMWHVACGMCMCMCMWHVACGMWHVHGMCMACAWHATQHARVHGPRELPPLAATAPFSPSPCCGGASPISTRKVASQHSDVRVALYPPSSAAAMGQSTARSTRAIMAPKPDGEIHILPWMSPSAASYLGVVSNGLVPGQAGCDVTRAGWGCGRRQGSCSGSGVVAPGRDQQQIGRECCEDRFDLARDEMARGVEGERGGYGARDRQMALAYQQAVGRQVVRVRHAVLWPGHVDIGADAGAGAGLAGRAGLGIP